jgi:hypothetical protein
MRSKVFVGLALVVGLAAGGVAWGFSGSANRDEAAPAIQQEVATPAAGCCITGDCCCPGQGACCDVSVRAKVTTVVAKKATSCCVTGDCCCPGRGACCATSSVSAEPAKHSCCKK